MVKPELKTTDDKLQLVIRSAKTSRVVEYDVPLMTQYGKVGVDRKRAIVDDYIFDERQTRALSEARDLAGKLGLTLEVTDLSRQGVLRRILRLSLGRINIKDPRQIDVYFVRLEDNTGGAPR